MSGRPAKSLLEHVEDRSFRARQHEELLETSALLRSPALRKLQSRYQRAKRKDTRRKIALEFERIVTGKAAALVPPAVQADGDGLVIDEGPSLAELLDELGPPESAERAIAFFPRFLTHRKGPLAGSPFELEEWQKAMLREAFRRKRGRRVYTLVIFVLPGGCGKSPLVAGLDLLALAELEDEPDIFCLASTKYQAGKVIDYAVGFVKGTPERPGELRRFFRIRGRKIENKRTGGSIEILPAGGASLEGETPSVVNVDELHAFEYDRHERSFTALIGKLHKRGHGFAISTAGRGEKNILRRLIKDALRSKTAKVTRRGYLTVSKDETRGILLWMYAAPKEAPLEDLDAIRKVTPASWLDPREILKLLYTIGEAEFRRLARNEWIGAKNQWMKPGLWDAIADPERAAKGLPPKGTKVALGFDGSYNNDATGLVGCTTDGYLFEIGVWERPEDDDEAAAWAVPRDEVKEKVDWAMSYFDVVRLAADPPGWYEEVAEWATTYEDVLVIHHPTNEVKLMAQACREFYADVVQSGKQPAGKRRLSHDGGEALARHIENAHTRETPDGAYITKEFRDSPNKIDLAVGAVLARYHARRAKPKRKNRLVSW